jgi:uncharacterized protein YndB with AHSA1/START domain
MGKWIKTLLILNVAVFAAIGGIWYWGSTLDTPYHAKITRYSQGTPSQVWSWLTNPDSLAKYHPEISNVRLTDTNWYSQRWSQHHSQLGPMEMQVIKAAIPHHLVIEFIAPHSGLRGLRSLQLSPQVDGQNISGTFLILHETGTWNNPLRRWWEQWVKPPERFGQTWLAPLSQKQKF